MTKTAKEERVPAAFLELQLTHRCNLSCRYCELERRRRDMTLETMLRGLDFLFTTKRDEIRVQFFGGEPLLRWDLVKKGIERINASARALKKKARPSIATNALLIDERMARYFLANNIEIIFSLDGGPSTHTFNRHAGRRGEQHNRKLYDRIAANLALLQRLGVPHFVNFVVDPERVRSLCSDTLFLVKDLRVEKLRLSYRIGCVWKPAEKRRYFEEMKRVVQELAALERDEAAQRVELLNFQASDEPVMSAASINLDTDGRLYYGCALIIRRSLAGLKDVSYIGRLPDFSCYDEIERRQSRLTARLRRTGRLSKSEKRIVLNNISFGMENRRFFEA